MHPPKFNAPPLQWVKRHTKIASKDTQKSMILGENSFQKHPPKFNTPLLQWVKRHVKIDDSRWKLHHPKFNTPPLQWVKRHTKIDDSRWIFHPPKSNTPPLQWIKRHAKIDDFREIFTFQNLTRRHCNWSKHTQKSKIFTGTVFCDRAILMRLPAAWILSCRGRHVHRAERTALRWRTNLSS